MNSKMGGDREEQPIRLVLVDDHGLFRDSLSRYLASERGLQVVGECGTPREAMELMSARDADLVLLGCEPGCAHSNEFMAMALQGGFRGRFLLLAAGDDAKPAALALKLGASGIFLKSDPLGRLVQAIHSVAGGRMWVDPKLIRTLAERFVEDRARPWDSVDSHLEDRERQVLDGILKGLTNKKIAVGLGLSESTVKNSVQRLFLKIGVRTRSQLVRAALEGAKMRQSQD